jgi:hypothetical protein
MDSPPGLSININHGTEMPAPLARNRAWILDTFDIKPPDSVLCAEFERLQIRFDFLEIRKKAKRAKKNEPAVADDYIEEEMLLDDPGVSFSPHGNMGELAHVVEAMGDLSSRVEQCFQPPLGFGEDPDLLQRHPLQLPHQNQIFAAPNLVQDIAKSDCEKDRGKNRRHPQVAIDILNAWFQAHADKPYPSKEEKSELARKTGLNWS